MTGTHRLRAAARHQSVAHGPGHDYTSGSPHLRHPGVHERVVAACREVVAGVTAERGHCRVLEIGAGHGVFTRHVRAVGAEVWVTEMSRASAEVLESSFAGDDLVHVAHDPDGTAAARGPEVDVVLCISVLHHMPDYLGTVSAVLGRVAPGGAFVSFQDPPWYPRRSRTSMLADRAAYLAWRVTRGDLRRGLATAGRRLRGRYDEDNPSDMVEYHVVRQGVDEAALAGVLNARFESVRTELYWSTQAAWLQRLGERVAPPNTFGLVATGRR